MNKRIEDLAEQANLKINYRIDPHSFKYIDDPTGPHIRLEFDKEKFAELIIQECAKIVENSVWELPRGYKALDQANLIKRHFGVEK